MHCRVLPYPGTTDAYLMAATLFHRDTDHRYVHFASSADGLSWQWLPGPYVASPEDSTPDWPYEEITAGYGFVPLAGDRIAVPIVEFSH